MHSCFDISDKTRDNPLEAIPHTEHSAGEIKPGVGELECRPPVNRKVQRNSGKSVFYSDLGYHAKVIEIMFIMIEAHLYTGAYINAES